MLFPPPVHNSFQGPLYLPPGAQLPLPHPKLPGSRSPGPQLSVHLLFPCLGQNKAQSFILQLHLCNGSSTLLALLSAWKSLSSSRHCGFMHINILNRSATLEGRNEKLGSGNFLPRGAESDSRGALTLPVNVYVPAANTGPDSLLWNLGHALLSPTMPPGSWLDLTLRAHPRDLRVERLAAR